MRTSTPAHRTPVLMDAACVSQWRGKSFIFEGGGLRIMVFQSAPPALEAPLAAPRPQEEEGETEQAARSDTAERARYE